MSRWCVIVFVLFNFSTNLLSECLIIYQLFAIETKVKISYQLDENGPVRLQVASVSDQS